MDPTTRCRSSKAASFLDEHFDGSTASNPAEDADVLVEGDVEGVFEGIVVEKGRIPPPEASVGVDEGVEGCDEAVEVDEGVVDE